MNSKNILDAMTDIESSFILSAQKKMGYDTSTQTRPAEFPRRRRTMRRTLALAAAVILMIAICFTTALAVSPEFQEMVFRFLHIEQEQVVPEVPVDTELSVDDMFVEPKVQIGDVIEGKYVHTPVSTRAREGVYLVCTDEVELNQGSHYDAYYEENGEFIKLEEHKFEQDYSLGGKEFHVEFEWTQHRDCVQITWVEANERFKKPNYAGEASAVLFQFNCGNEDGVYPETWYPVLLNLYTGELTDILADTGAEQLEYIDNAAISEDHTKMLLGQNANEGYFLYYVDLIAKQMYSIDELSVEHADACSLIGENLICWTLTNGCYTAWNIDLVTFARTELFDSVFDAAATPEADAGIVFMMGFDDLNHWGNMYAGSRFALEVDEVQNVYVINLVTGGKTQIEGYTWTPDTRRIPSPDGTKLLLAGGPDGQDFEYVGVLDFEHMTFVEFARNNSNEVHEYLAYWFDGNTILINAEATSDSLCSDYYLYSLISNSK